MASKRPGSIHLFRFAGIDLFLHWSWFLVAAFEISNRAGSYSTIAWNVLEYLALFFIVMLHEYGHALACRQVGGTANQIMLWPLGGVAYVDPPPRPGATLWSIAAGPLVNVALLVIVSPLGILLDRSLGLAETAPDAHAFLRALWFINLGLLIFNLLPVYPLDGGQILRSLLWFAVGRARSLMAAVVIGFVGVAGLLILALRMQSVWFGVLSLFILTSCWSGWRQAQALYRFAKLPRHEGFACPACKAAPLVGRFWKCGRCGETFDTFQTRALCPNCSAQVAVTTCPDCRAQNPLSEWIVPASVRVN
ncbi:MAG: site-2 protease family protein [Terriglobia bacterium]